MCNSYRVKPKRSGEHGIRDRVSDAADKLPSSLVRPTNPGVVMRADGRVEIMRWGFHRSFNPAINNARADKLEAGMWTKAFHECRCVIPMTAYYEWGPGSGGRKQAYEFCDPDDDYLWVAGIWEENDEFGLCYTMVTTASSPLMQPIHDRMPAVLRPEEMGEFLAGNRSWNFQPFPGQMVATPCESPLAKPRTPSDSQAELF